MPRIYKPFMSIVNITDSMTDELAEQLFEKSIGLAVKGPAHLEDGSYTSYKNILSISPNDSSDDDDHYNGEMDKNYALMHGRIMDCYSEAFNDNLECQEDLMSHLMLLNRTVNSTFDASTIENVYGTLVHEILLEGNDDAQACSFTMIIKANDGNFYAVVYFINHNVIQMDFDGPIYINPNAEQDDYRSLSISKVIILISRYLSLVDRDDIGRTVVVERDEWYSFYGQEENQTVFRYNKIWAKVMNDALDDTTVLYRLLKPTKLFSIDDINIHLSKDVLYINNLGTADVMEDLLESFEDLANDDDDETIDSMEALVEGVEEFGKDGNPLEGVLLTRNSVQGIPSEPHLQQQRQVAFDHSLYATIGLMGYSLPEGDPESLMFKEAHEVYQGLVTLVGNLRARKNDFIREEEGKETVITTSFGQINVAETPLWIVLIIIPYMNYLMRTVKDYDQFNEEVFFEDQKFEFLIEHIERMSAQRLN